MKSKWQLFSSMFQLIVGLAAIASFLILGFSGENTYALVKEYEAAVNLARDSGCYNLTLNVWSCNPSAMKFYEAQGLVPQKVSMDLVLPH